MSAAAAPDAAATGPSRRWSWPVVVIGLLIVALVCALAWWRSEDRVARNLGDELADLPGVASVHTSQDGDGNWRFRMRLDGSAARARVVTAIERAAATTGNDRLHPRVELTMGAAVLAVDRADAPARRLARWLVPLSRLPRGTTHLDADSPRIFVSTHDPGAGAAVAAAALTRLADADAPAPGVLFAGGNTMPGRVSVVPGAGLRMDDAAEALTRLAPVARRGWGMVLSPGRARLLPPARAEGRKATLARARALLAPLHDRSGRALFGRVVLGD